jgi:hypothetical protein
LDSEPVAVVVGEAKQEFLVHESHIRSCSEFFDLAMRGDWKEKNSRTINLPEADPRAFTVYIKWLYSGQFFIKNDDDEAQYDEDTECMPDDEWTKWSLSYKLGNFLMDYEFKDALIDMAIDKMRWEGYYADLPNDVYQHSREGSMHRKLAIDIAVHTWPGFEFKLAEHREHDMEFLIDLVAATGEKIRIGVEQKLIKEFLSPDMDSCKYHDHKIDGMPCYRDKRKFLL